MPVHIILNAMAGEAASGVVTGLATLCVALRFFVRVRIKVRIGWDDWWMLIGLLLTLVTGGVIICGISDHAQAANIMANSVQVSV